MGAQGIPFLLFDSVRILVLTTDAFGGYGGIAQYNRDLLEALSTLSGICEVVAIPRNMHFSPSSLPSKLQYRQAAAGSKLRFVLIALAEARRRFDLVICGHINLLPLASLVRLKSRAPIVLLVYGIEVWQRPASRLTRWLATKIDAVWSISEFTRDKMLVWNRLPAGQCQIIPNAIDLNRYSPGPRNPELVARYGLEGRKILMVLGRLSASEQYKGIDEVFEALPQLIKREPNLVFFIAGDGDDRPRLEAKAHIMGLAGHVVFAGFVPEAEKIDHFRLADAYVMPGRGEGFGFVFLEAMACGIPVLASSQDGSREAVRGGLLGQLVNPDRQTELQAAILNLLAAPRVVPEGLNYFAFPEFEKRVHAAVSSMVSLPI